MFFDDFTEDIGAVMSVSGEMVRYSGAHSLQTSFMKLYVNPVGNPPIFAWRSTLPTARDRWIVDTVSNSTSRVKIFRDCGVQVAVLVSY